MKKERSLKQQLVSAVLVLAMAFSMLVGTTFAWFTDSVSSSGNTIQAGTLKIDLLHKVDDDWISLKEEENHKIFDYDKWEPGYTRVETVKAKNLGNLALKYKFSFTVEDGTAVAGPNGELLAEVIDVYVSYGDKAESSYDAIKSSSEWIYKGTLLELMQNPSSFVGGELLPAGKALDANAAATTASGEQLINLALHMRESAGNEYQKLSVGNVFVNLIATQWSYENDSFGNDYDALAPFPPLKEGSATAIVEVENGKTKSAVEIKGNGFRAIVPAGTDVNSDEINSLVLSVEEKDVSDANIVLEENQVLRPMDVHIEGVSKDNTKVIIVVIDNALAPGYNSGNYSLAHVEGGNTNDMTIVSSVSELDAHNECYYDPATGEIHLALASFSEVALVADTENAWEGNYDYTWYNADSTELFIANADQLAAFGAIVGGMKGQTQDSFNGKTVTLLADINLGDKESENDPNLIFYPIGYYNSEGTYEKTGTAITSGLRTFEGTFDGNGNTISNFYQNTWEMKGDNGHYSASLQYYNDGMGLFGKVYGGTVKNLTVANFSSDGEYTTTGTIAAYADFGAKFENIAIIDCNPRVYNIGNGGIVGCVGWYTKGETNEKVTFSNITVDNSNKISALWGSWDVACGGIVGQYYPTSGQSSANYPKNPGIDFNNCHVSAQIDVYNDVCANYQYYAYRYAGMIIGSIRENTTNSDGKTIPKMDGISATGCTVNYGTWNDYYYCEFEKNTMASYSDDYQFSRVPHSELNFTDTNGNGIIDTAEERASVAGCKHNHTAEEDKQAVYLPFHQLFTGYSWGVSSIGLKEYSGIVTDLDITEGDKEESVEKFEAIINGDSFETETTLTLGEIFSAKDGVEIKLETLKVFVSPVDENSNVSAIYTPDLNDWTKGTLKFSGIGAAKIVITDYNFCKETVTSITIRDFDAVDKFEANENLVYEHILDGDTISKKLGDIFSAVENAEINSANVVVNVENNGANCVYTKNSSDWTQSTLAFTGVGDVILTITDENYCKVATATVRILNPEETDKFSLKFENTEKYLYRVGNANAIKLSSLFAAELPTGAVVNVTFEYNGNVEGTYTSQTPWQNGTVKFSGTGVAIITIDSNAFTKAKTLVVEVVDAVNATGATDAKENNVVLLNDIGSGFTVSNGFAVYGNGFSLNYTGDGRYLNKALKLGVVTVSNGGTLDNLRIKCSIYPIAALYHDQVKNYYEVDTNDTTKTRYFYQLSAVAISGNSTISNCYIYGARNNIFVDTGDVTIKDTILECGVVSNIQIVSNDTHAVTLENVTTIQHQVTPTTYANDSLKDNVLLGFGVLVGDGESASNPKLIINGEFKQYNWVNEDDQSAVTDTYGKQAIDSALSVSKYQHTVNGKTSTNMGIVYLNTSRADFENNSNLPYEKGSITVSAKSGQVYSLVGATENQIYSDYSNADRSTVNGLYVPQFKFDDDLGGQYIQNSEGCDEFCYVGDGKLNVMFISGDEKALDLMSLVNVSKYTGQELGLAVSVKDANGNDVVINDGVITLSRMMDYIITYTVTDTVFYDKDGNVINGSKDYSWDVELSVALKDKSTPNAYFEFDATAQKMGYYKPSVGNVIQYLPFLAGLKIYDYVGQNSYIRFDGSTDFNKIASVTITGYGGDQNHEAFVEVRLTDGGVINTMFLARADSGGGSTYTGTIKISNNTIYFVNDKGTSNKDTTTTAAYWYVDYYKFTGNNGVAIQSAQQTFNSTGSSASTPSGSFSTTIKYTVTYDANDGVCGQSSGYATSANASVTLPTPTRPGFVCKGWYTEKTGGTLIGAVGGTYTPSQNITLYAQWRSAGTVIYDANGGASSQTSAYYDLSAPLTLPSASKDGYTFTGWFTEKIGGVKLGNAGDSFTPDGAMTVYAQWTKACTVTYDHYYGQGDITSAVYDGTNPLTLPTLTNGNGFWFDGWYTAMFGGVRVGGSGDSYTPAGEDITLYAQWKNDVVVNYDLDGGSCGTTSATYTGAALTLPTPTKAGYDFLGWYDASGNKVGDAGKAYSPDYDLQADPISETLVAKWEAKPTYSITINKQENATVTIDKTSTYEGDTVTVTVSFSKNYSKKLVVKDASGEELLNKTAAGTYTFKMPASAVTIEASSSSTCVTGDTLITLADGTQKEIKDVRVGDFVLAWNFYTGSYEIVPVSLLQAHSTEISNVLHLYFEDGTELKLIGEHGVFDVDLNTFVFIDEFDVENYIGHSFVKQSGDGFDTVKLVGYEITTENVTSYTILSLDHYNVLAEGMLTVTPAHVGDNFFNPFDIGEDMKYDEDAVKADIEKYGLYTYEDFSHVVTEEQFDALNLAHFKVSVGKGYVTYEGLIYLIENFVNNEDFNVQ